MILAFGMARPTMLPKDQQEGVVAIEHGHESSKLIDWGGAMRAIGAAARFVWVHASLFMAALVLCLFAMVIVWLLYQPSPLF